MIYFENLLLRLQGASLSLAMALFLVVTSSAPPEARADVILQQGAAGIAATSAAAGNAEALPPGVSAQLASVISVSAKLETIAAELRRIRPARTDAPDFAGVRAGVGDLNPLRIGDHIQQTVASLGDFEASVRVEWEAELDDMAARGLDRELIDRHRQGLDEFLRKSAEFRSLLGPLNEGMSRVSPDDSARALIAMADFFSALPSARAFAAIGDSARLPIQFSRADATPAPSDITDADAKLAKAAHDPPGPADLAPTIDIELTPEIVALAQQLGGQPVAIRNWVYNNIEFTPTFGSIQGAALTLLNRRGNAHDTASLMIALLRASGIPARYAKSVIEIPVERVQNWLDDVETPQMALDLMQKGGIPTAGVLTAGRLSAIRFEHVWVEAWIDFIPSRGAVNRVPDQWVAFDAAFKQFVYEESSNWREENLTDRHELMRQFVENFNVDATGGISGLDFDRVYATMQVMAMDLANDVTAANPQATAEFLYPARSIIEIDDTIIAGTLPFPLRSQTILRFAEIPAASRHQLIVAFYADETALRFESPSREISLPLSRIGAKQLWVDYIPATPADAAAIAQFAESNAQSMPIGSMRVIPKLMLGADILFEDGAARMGTQHFWTANLRDVHGNETRTEAYRFAAGSTIAFVPNHAGMPAERLEREHAGESRLALLATKDALHLGAQIFWTLHDHLDEQAALGAGGRTLRMPSIGAFAQPLEVRYFFGVPRTGYVTGRITDVKASRIGMTLPEQSQFTNVSMQLGAGGSMAESASWSLLFGTTHTDLGMSTATLIAQAIDDGQRLFQIDSTNVDVRIQQLQLSPDAETEIRQAALSGQIVVAHEREITRRGWSGSGYVIYDPISGAQIQRVDGGYAGGINVGCVVYAVSLKILCDRKFFAAASAWLIRLGAQVGARLLGSAAVLAFLGPAGAAAGIVLAIISAVQIAIAVAYAAMEVTRWVRSIEAGIESLTREEMIELGINAINDIACSYSPPCLPGLSADNLGFGSGSGSGGDGPSDDRGAGGPMMGNPVAIGSGAKWQTEVDFEGNGRFPLRFARSYNSGKPKNDSFVGAKWEATYFQRLRLPPNTDGSLFPVTQRPDAVMIWRPEGGWQQFDWRNGAYVGESNVPGKVDRLVSAGATIGWAYTNTRDEVERFDPHGRLLSITDRAGLTQTLAYDPLLRPISVTDAYGRSLQFVYSDSTGYLERVIDPRDREIVFEHALQGQLTRVTYPDNRSREYHYEDLGHLFALTGITDERGIRTSSWTYDSLGRVKTAQRADGIESYQFDYAKDATRVIDPLGTMRTYEYARVFDRPYLRRVTEPCAACGNGSVAETTYDSRGLIASRIDFKQNRTTYQRESRGLITTTTEAVGTPIQRVTTRTWDTTRHLITRLVEPIAAGNRTTDFTYDNAGNLTRRAVTANAQTRVWTYTWQNGLLTSEDGPRTDVVDATTYTYDSQGNRSTMTDPIGHVTRYTRYDGNGLLLEMVDPNGLLIEYFYDERDQLVRTESGPEGSAEREITRYRYDGAGNLTRITSPDGSFSDYTYDGANRLTSVVDTLGNRVTYTLDGMGNRIATRTHAAGGGEVMEETAEFDALGRLRESRGADDQYVTVHAYDDNGNEISVTDPLLNETEFDYDALNRVVSRVDPYQNEVEYGYDPQGNLILVSDPRDLVTRYGYNGFDDLTRIESPDTGVITQVFDSVGNVATRSDARGEVAAYAYDAESRLTSISYDDERITLGYDDTITGGAGARSRLTRVSTESIGVGSRAIPNTTAYAYDIHGRVTRKIQSVGSGAGPAATKEVGFHYDAQGRIDAHRLPSGAVVGYQYGADGRILTITINGQTLVREIEYFPFGEPKAWRYGSHRYERSFDRDGRVRTHSLGSNTRIIDFDDGGRVAEIADPAGASWSFGYDDLDRLTNATNSAVVGPSAQHGYAYAYDATGNRASETVAVGAGAPSLTTYAIAANSNRLTAVGAAARVYDGAGNTTRWTAERGANANQVLDAVYSARNRWVETSRAGVGIRSHSYNPFGERVASWASDATIAATQVPATQFVYDEDGHLIGEYGPGADAAAAANAEHIWLGDTPIALLTGDNNTHQGIGIAASAATASPARTAYMVHPDHFNTPRSVVNANNLIVWHWNSAPFGDSDPDETPSISEGVPGALNSAVAFSYSLRFPGQRFDPDTGTHYNYYRDYDASAGRYVQSDPIGLLGSLALYDYVDSEPTKFSDSFGLQKSCSCLANEAADTLPQIQRERFVTVAVGRDPGGQLKVACNGKRVPKPVKDWAGRNGIEVVPGSDGNHAEDNLMDSGPMSEIDASRPRCSDCEKRMDDAGVKSSTPGSGKPSRRRKKGGGCCG